MSPVGILDPDATVDRARRAWRQAEANGLPIRERRAAEGAAVIAGSEAFGRGQPRSACPFDPASEGPLAERWEWAWDMAAEAFGAGKGATGAAHSHPED